MALLIATSLAVSLMAAHGEIAGMRACGVPAIRGLSPMLALCALIAPPFFLFSNVVLPRTTAYYDEVGHRIKDRSYRGIGVPAYRRKTIITVP